MSVVFITRSSLSANRYFPITSSEEAGDRAINRILDKIFHGSAEHLLARLVSDRDISQEEIDRMRKMLDEASRRDDS